MGWWCAVSRTVRDLAFDAARGLHRYPWPTAAASTVALGVGAASAHFGWHDPAVYATGAGAAGQIGAASWWWCRQVARPSNAKKVLTRISEHQQRSGGTASRLDIQQ